MLIKAMLATLTLSAFFQRVCVCVYIISLSNMYVWTYIILLTSHPTKFNKNLIKICLNTLLYIQTNLWPMYSSTIVVYFLLTSSSNSSLWWRRWLSFRLPGFLLLGLYHLLHDLLNFHIEQVSGWQRICRINRRFFFRFNSPVDRAKDEDLHARGFLRITLSNSCVERK